MRIQSSSAVDKVIGAELFACKASGTTSANGSLTKRQIMKPIVAFQKPITIQGSVKANRMRIATCADGETAGPSARCMSHIKKMNVLMASVANRIRRS